MDSAGVKKTSDIELIALVRGGDQFAFKEIIRRHQGKVAAAIYGMIGRCDEAEDIGQDVFIRFYKSIHKFRGDSSLSTYLVRIAINLTLNEIRRRKLKALFSFDKMVEDGYDVASDHRTEKEPELKELIDSAMNKLPAKYRAVVVLRLINGYTTEETAKILDLPLGTVLSRLSRAQAKLKDFLGPYFN